MSLNIFHDRLKKIEKDGNIRLLRDYSKHGINLSSNDYLSISNNEIFVEEFFKLFGDNKNIFSASSSRLLDGNHKYYRELEQNISEYYKREVITFNSGYHLNIGVLPTLTKKDDLIIADKLVHASLIDGFRLSNAKVLRYRHLDYDQLEEYLHKYRKNFDNVFIVTESVFSMDGDIVDLNKIVDIKEKYNSFLYLDEAHSVGVYGERGLGICEQSELIDKIDFIAGTFGKALGSVGAFLVCDKIIKKILINSSRPLIYTTALPPINIAWTNFIFNKVINMSNQRKYLNKISCEIKNHIESKGLKTLGNSHIIPILIEGNKECSEASEYFRERGILALPIRNPTVEKGKERIRFSLNSSISEYQKKIIFEALDNL